MKRRKLIRSFAVLVICAVLFSVFFSLHSSSAIAGNNGFDLSRPGFSGETYNFEYTAADLLLNLGFSVPDSERQYLTETSALSVVYPKSIPASYVSFSHDHDTLTVRAKAYSYKASSGAFVKWIPKSVRLSSGTAASLTLSGDEYTAELYLDEFSGELYLDVDYTASVTVPKETVNELINKAFSDGKTYSEANVAYLADLAEYNAKLLRYEGEVAKYNELLSEYQVSYALYQKYVSDKKIYNELYLQYKKYLSDLEAYKADLESYNKYLLDMEKYRSDYQAYLASEEKKASLENELRAYEEYLAQMELISYRLSLVESLKTNVSSLERNIYDAIMGSTVTAVIENEDVIAGNLIGADRDAVEMAGRATSWLRILFDGYFSKTNDEDKFIYYKVNYRRFRDNVANLFCALDNLYQNDRVRELIKSKEMDEKYAILLSQLYFASHAFSDEPVSKFGGAGYYDSSYGIDGFPSPSEIIGAEDYYVDLNKAAPASSDVYPIEVIKPDYTPVPKPTMPKEVKEPTAPEEVKEPTPPTEASEPLKPSEPSAPKVPIAPFSDNSPESRIAASYASGALSEREWKIFEDYTAEFSVTMKKSLGATSVSVVYHDESGKEVGVVSLDRGSFAEIDYLPEKAADAEANYNFSSWVDADGNPVDLNEVYFDLSVYPSFTKTIKAYTVSWVVGSEVIPSSVLYGEIPVPPKTPFLQGNESVTYAFLAWSLDGITPIEPVAVNANVTYTAIFEPQYTVPLDGAGASVFRSDGALYVDLKAYSDIEFRIDRLLSFADGQIVIRMKSADITLPYAECLALMENEAQSIKISLNNSSEYADFFVSVCGENAVPLDYSAKLSVLSKTDMSGGDLRLFTHDSEGKSYLRFELEGGFVNFNLNTGRTVRLAKENSLSVFENDLVGIELDCSVASPGEKISINVSCSPGVRIRGYYYVGSDGTRYNLSGSEFVMPTFSVTVGVEAEVIYYTVSFESDGVVISTAKYQYGEKIRIPTDPTKPTDEEFSYKFIGWSPTVTEAIADVTYTACFEKTAVDKSDGGGLKISNDVMRLIVTAGLFSVLFLFAVIPSSVISVSLFVKRKRRRTDFVTKSDRSS